MITDLEFRVLLVLDLLPYKALSYQELLVIKSRKNALNSGLFQETNCKFNTNSRIQNLNLAR